MKPLLVVVLLVVLAGCSGGTSETTTSVPTAAPATVATLWIDAVTDVDVDALAFLVEPVGLAVVAGVENSVSSDEMVGLLSGGFAGDLATGYWTTFRDDFAAIRGVAVESLVVGEEIPVEDMPEFIAVALSADETAGRVILRRGATGWQIDMAASVGPVLVGQLGDYLASAQNGDNAAAITAAYETAIVPALEAAVALDQTNSDLVFGTEYITQLVDELPVTEDS